MCWLALRPDLRPSGTATHKNHGPPLAPLSSQITKATTLIASQNRPAARHARTRAPMSDSADGTATGLKPDIIQLDRL